MFFLITILSVITIGLMILEYVAPALFLIFLVLRLCGVILWSWWLVCLPLILLPIMIIINIALTFLISYLTDKM